MKENVTEILEKALELPSAERAELVDRLLASLDLPTQEKIDELWAQEAEDRLNSFEQGEVKAIPAEAVFGELFKRKI